MKGTGGKGSWQIFFYIHIECVFSGALLSFFVRSFDTNLADFLVIFNKGHVDKQIAFFVRFFKSEMRRRYQKLRLRVLGLFIKKNIAVLG